MNTMPWFRFYSETANDIKFDFLSRELDMPKYSLIGIWAILECIASRSPVRGYLYVTEKKRYSNKDIAAELKIETVLCSKIMQAFTDMDMLEEVNGVVHLKNWDKRQYQSDNSTERVHKYRQEHPVKRYCNVSVTPPETESDTETEKEAKPEPPIPASFSDDPIVSIVATVMGIPPNSNDLPAIKELEDMNALEDDIRGGYDWLKSKEKTVSRVSQLVGPTRTAMAKRLNPKSNGSKPSAPDSIPVSQAYPHE